MTRRRLPKKETGLGINDIETSMPPAARVCWVNVAQLLSGNASE
jgi:hypothetical protein